MRQTTRFFVSNRGLSMATCATLAEHFTRPAHYDGAPGTKRVVLTRLRMFKSHDAACGFARRKAREHNARGKPQEYRVYAVRWNGFWPWAELLTSIGPSGERIGKIAALGIHLNAATRGGVGQNGNPHANPRWHKIAKGRKGTNSAFLSATAKTSGPPEEL